MTDWGDLNARARGLATRLIPPAALSALDETTDLDRLAARFADLGIGPADPPVRTPAALELAIRRWVGAQVRLLSRWVGSRAPLLRVALEEEDRRSLHALVRGAAAGVAAEQRLAGLIPTLELSERLLAELARQPRVPEMAALLMLWQHPYATAVHAGADSGEPDLFRIECAIDRTFAGRASAGARAGDGLLRRHVADVVDGMNLVTALMLADRETEWPPELAFLPGGRTLNRDAFVAAARAAGARECGDLLAAIAGPGEVARLIRRHALAPARLEAGLRSHRGRLLRRQARVDPLSAAVVLSYLHRLREQTDRLRGAVWGTAFGAPPASRMAVLEGVA